MKSLPRVLALLLALLLPLCALGEAASAWTDVPYIAFSEPYGYSLINIGPGCRMQVGQHSYLFLKATKEETRSGIIAKTEAALTALQAFGAADRAYTIHVVKGSYAPRVDGDTLYIGTASYNTAAYVTGLAGLVYGSGVNYGLLYGVSCVVAESLGIPVDTPVPLADALSSFTGENRAYLDLNYACFIAPYADEPMQANAQSVSRAFAASLTAEETASLLGASTNEAFYTSLSRFLAANGQEPYDSPLTGYSFHGGGDGSVRLRWERDGIVYILDNQYQDTWSEHLAYLIPDPFNSDYPALQTQVLHMQIMQEYAVDALGNYCTFHPYIVWLENHDTYYGQANASGFWRARENTIHLRTVVAYTHEIIHAMTEDTRINPWMDECVAYYFDTIGSPEPVNYDFRIEFADYYPYLGDPGKPFYDETWPAFAQQLIQLLGREIDYASTEDLLFLFGAEFYCNYTEPAVRLQRTQYTDLGCHQAKLLFCHYLVTQYGTDATLRAAITDDPVTHLGAAWNEIIAHWTAHLDTSYGPLKN